ncbi:MAG: hypothetical protein IPN14_00195 [Bacteroidetes bacterium]|nr:hypothetical protein [Bacteroidota bacterium]
MTDELFNLADSLDSNAIFTLYLPNADLTMNVATSIRFIALLKESFALKKLIDLDLIYEIVAEIK